jgi:hypothetical protein
VRERKRLSELRVRGLDLVPEDAHRFQTAERAAVGAADFNSSGALLGAEQSGIGKCGFRRAKREGAGAVDETFDVGQFFLD